MCFPTLKWTKPTLTDCVFFFFDGAACYVHGAVNRNSCVWGSGIPHDVTELGCDSWKASVWFALMKKLSVFSLLRNSQWLVTISWLCVMYLWEQFYSYMVVCHFASPIMSPLPSGQEVSWSLDRKRDPLPGLLVPQI